jgi:hypothetical protein
MRWLLMNVAFATAMTCAGNVAAEDVCINEKAKPSLACPGGGPRELDASRRAGVELHTVAPLRPH